ncbi:timeless protein-domain-containing protein [Kockovaella imperatae]|uniref:Timeless protein-domain-containing protein n=1 Tax=Kockovaella imperatae TaxID=4999 RepID=A0A1Y1UPV2_9TREE|nr:timeless protein-domain-containing protein [Kockovaella imperatae]ORX39175.1 timeless protein-domain-containing protein [Kockovaella imperatae]
MTSIAPLHDSFDMEMDDMGYDAPSSVLGVDEPETDRFAIFMPAVQSLVNALGGYEEVRSPQGGFQTIYRPGDSVLAVMKDLKRLWRKDDGDDERTVARCMARAGLMKELIALVTECTERGDWGRKVGLVACDLIAALTWPIDVQAELKEMDDEPDLVTDYQSLLRAQMEYKAMILHTNGTLRCLLALMLPSLASPQKNEKDQQVISLGLHVVRNLLAIKDLVPDGLSTGDKLEFSHLQSRLLIQLNSLTYFQLFLTLASCADRPEFNHYNVIVLDILHLIFRPVKAKELVLDQDRAPLNGLTKLLEKERRDKAMHHRVGMTRHSRFGTTIAVRAGDQKLVLHKQNAITVDAGKMLDDVKRIRAGRLKRFDELAQPTELSPEAMKTLQSLAKTFLESCFNTFFSSILKDIRMERSKVRVTDNLRTFFLSRFFVDYLLLRRDKATAEQSAKAAKAGSSSSASVEVIVPVKLGADLSLGLVAEMAEIDTVRWVVMRMKSTMEEKPPSYRELQACLSCFTQILLLIDAMSLSPEEEDVEVAEILQNRLYYNGDILDSSLQVISQYKDQSVAYLETVVDFAYVLLKMLERYSKNKSFMFVRKRKAARRKRKAGEATQAPGPTAEEYAGDEEGEDDGAEKDTPSYAEHTFTFQAFEKRFANEAVVNTLLSYLSRYKTFEDPDQMKRIVSLMHRQVVKTQAEGLYFKVTTLQLFRQLLDDAPSLPRADSSRDAVQLIKFILRKFFKRVAEDPFLIVQAFGPKTRGHWKELSSYKSDDESDDGMGGQRDRIREKLERAPAELEYKKNKKMSWSQQMGTTVALLIQAGHKSWIEWIADTLEIVHAARTEIVLTVDGPQISAVEDELLGDETSARNFGGPSKDALAKFAQYADIDSGEDQERRNALAKDAHFRLMLKLLSFDHSDAEKGEHAFHEHLLSLLALDQQWFIPSTIPPSNLATSFGALRQYLADPPSLADDHKDLLQKVRKRRAPAHGDDEQPHRHRKRAAEVQNYKSAAFIEDSDDDEEADRAFFEREKALRAEMDELARRQGHHALSSTQTIEDPGAGRQKRSKEIIAEEDDAESDIGSVNDEMVMRAIRSSTGSDSDRSSPERFNDRDSSPPVSRKRASSHASGSDSPASENATTQSRKRKMKRVFVNSDSDSE